ncbi:hypothetical protein C2S53_016293 [Perilla frutescens var. hirtella]|uniref:Uncharacterized protein n=1 Tax=Perilla frutescens var. hirtella TaxID=608512 RepID=A0AAD4JDY3_PERFH|nr:hypothetical protein C2S53_016293 [Perilla frutescens var. hirtella]
MRVAVVGEAGAEIGAARELPDRVGLFSADAGDPARAELHGDAAELLLPYSPPILSAASSMSTSSTPFSASNFAAVIPTPTINH